MGWAWTGDAKEAKQRAIDRLAVVIDEEASDWSAPAAPPRRRKRRGDWFPSPRSRVGSTREQEAATNDGIWGRGQWVECSQCPDHYGRPSFHHRRYHDHGPVE